jgi:predicted phage terminase large subunit-like protein
MQRLNEDDPTGKWLAKGEGVKHICIPAETCETIQPKELEQYYEGGIMNTLRSSRESLDEMRKMIGSQQYASQFLQTPSKIGGGIIKKHWFQKFDGVALGTVDFFIDTAYTANTQNDASAIIAYFKQNNNLYILDCTSVRLEFPDLCKFIVNYTARNGYNDRSRIFVEPKASGLSIIQQLKKITELNIVTDQSPTESKLVRLTSCSPVVEAGRVFLTDNGAWVDDFIHEVCSFPFAKHDDKVDCLISAIRLTLYKKKGFTNYSAS